MDAAGTLGIVGYLRDCQTSPANYGWPARQPDGVARARIGRSQKPRRPAEQLDEVAAYFGFGSNGTNHSRQPAEPVQRPIGPDARTGRGGKRNPLRPLRTRKRTKSKGRTQKANQPPDPDLPVDRPGRTSWPAHARRHHGSEGVLRVASGHATRLGGTPARGGTPAHRTAPRGRELRKRQIARISRKSSFLRTILLGGT